MLSSFRSGSRTASACIRRPGICSPSAATRFRFTAGHSVFSELDRAFGFRDVLSQRAAAASLGISRYAPLVPFVAAAFFALAQRYGIWACATTRPRARDSWRAPPPPSGTAMGGAGGPALAVGSPARHGCACPEHPGLRVLTRPASLAQAAYDFPQPHRQIGNGFDARDRRRPAAGHAARAAARHSRECR